MENGSIVWFSYYYTETSLLIMKAVDWRQLVERRYSEKEYFLKKMSE